MPPEYLWEDSEGLELWWASVEDKRKDGSTGRGSETTVETDDDQGPGMAENDIAQFLKRS